MIHNNDHQNGRMVTRNGSSLTNVVGSSSVHFILSIKKGSVAKVLNMDSLGKPAGRLKELLSIYKHEDADDVNSSGIVSWQTNRSKGHSGDYRVKLGLSSPEEGDHPCKMNNNGAIDDSQSIFHTDNADLETNLDGDELNDMTLKELQFRCKQLKAKKSNLSLEADPKNHTHAFQRIKSEHTSAEPVELESDLEEPLIFLKQKLSKKLKPQRKRRKCTHPCISDSVVSTEESNEKKCVSCSNKTQSFISSECALSMDDTGEFQLNIIKEEELEVDSYGSQTVVAAAEYSASSSLPEHRFPGCILPEVSEESQGNELESRGSASMRSNILCCSINEVSGSESHILNPGTSEDAMEICSRALSPIQEMGHCSVNSPEVTYILEPNLLSVQDAVTAIHYPDYGFVAKCRPPGKSLDEALELNHGCETEKEKPLSFTEKTPYSSVGEVSFEHHLLNHQIFLQESTRKNFDVSNNLFSPFIGSFEKVSRTAGPCSGASGSGKSTIRVKDIMLETVETKNEQKDGAVCCTREMCNKTDNLVCAFNAECEIDDNQIYEVAAQNMVTGSSRIDSGETNVSHGTSNVGGEIPASAGNNELVEEMATYIPGPHSECSLSKSYTNSTSRSSSLLSSGANCLHSADTCLDENETHLEEQLSHLKTHEVSTCSNSFLPPVDVEVLEAAARQKCLSQSCDQLSLMGESLHVNNSPKMIEKILIPMLEMFSNEDKVSNQSAEISSCSDVARHEEDEALEYSLEHPPIKLLSNRKALSPTSQEKLCKAVDAESDKASESGQKLLFEKRTNDSLSPESGNRVSELMSDLERMQFSGSGKRLRVVTKLNCKSLSESDHRVPELMLSPERMSKKPNNSSLHPTTKGILKSPFSSMKPCSCIDSSLIHKHTQEAITFSQRQMHDIESLAMKLVTGLKSMKSIIEEALNSETCLSEPSKYNTDKMRIAIGNASELEDTTKRWLSMMGKDCNRFCKILRSTVYKTASVGGLRKEQKKITFADEAGGTLCHVKVFEGHASSLVDSEHEKVDPFTQTIVQ